MNESNRWVRAFEKEPCMEIINSALTYPTIHVLAIGPESCLRTLYFRALHENQNDNLHFIEVTAQELTMASHLSFVEKILHQMVLHNSNIEGILIYISCGDLIAGTYYDEIINRIEKKKNVTIRQFIRGPLTRRKTKPKERLHVLIQDMQLQIENNKIKGCVK